MVLFSCRVRTGFLFPEHVFKLEYLLKAALVQLMTQCQLWLLRLSLLLSLLHHLTQLQSDAFLRVIVYRLSQHSLYLPNYGLTNLVVLVNYVVIILQLKVTFTQEYVSLLNLLHFKPKLFYLIAHQSKFQTLIR